MHILFAAISALLLTTSIAAAQGAKHNGYINRNGTYVQPYYSSPPDRSYNNNYSVQPNYNPYTGQLGTRQPTWNDRPPSQPFSGGSSGLYSNPYSTRRR
jgi:hypothetical protein